ncbi:MAG: YraN family protein [Rickettsiaceae bacterium]|nr:YraN family protein [Rickettsiaceae bacterium]
MLKFGTICFLRYLRGILMLHIHQFGLLAEYLVMIRYMLKGYLPINHRYKSKIGEIDLIFKRGSSIIFCEVKARSGLYDIENIVSKAQKARILRAADFFLAKNQNMDIQHVELNLAVVKSLFDIKIYRNWLT